MGVIWGHLFVSIDIQNHDFHAIFSEQICIKIPMVYKFIWKLFFLFGTSLLTFIHTFIVILKFNCNKQNLLNDAWQHIKCFKWHLATCKIFQITTCNIQKCYSPKCHDKNLLINNKIGNIFFSNTWIKKNSKLKTKSFSLRTQNFMRAQQ